MKKALSLILALVTCLYLCACGNELGDELNVENAIAETPAHILHDVRENQARAMQNIYLFNCSVKEITDNYFDCGNNMRICLSSNELAKLNKGDTIAIIGKITNVEEVEPYEGAHAKIILFGKAKIYSGEVPEVTYRDYEIFKGTIISKVKNPYDEYNIRIMVNGDEALIYFADGEDVSSINEGDKITFTASIYGTMDLNGNYISIGAYQNAKILND